PTPLPYRAAKRTLDVIAASAGLILASPVLVLIAVAIRAESPGSVMFSQERIGLGGRPFLLYKFRTMNAAADEESHRRLVHELIRGSASDDDAVAGTWVPLEGEPRVTRVGRVLRRSQLDEVHQLIDVLRGERRRVGRAPVNRLE